MKIRSATIEDIPKIVELLRISLGENLMPKSEGFWKWKHLENPFGESPTLLAFDSEQLIGVRAFMRWEWIMNATIYTAVRAVDTATHPNYQGKGIFRMLTQQLVDTCLSERIDFIFNTPNKISRPGYEKLGWKHIGRLPVFFLPYLSFTRKKEISFDSKFSLYSKDVNQLLDVAPHMKNDKLSTRRSIRFLNWRYTMNPNVQYYAFGEPGAYAFIFRLKPTRWGMEFRIADMLIDPYQPVQTIKKHLQDVVRQSGASIVTWSGDCQIGGIKLSIGPDVIWRPLSLHNFLSFDFWNPSLGDMEVF